MLNVNIGDLIGAVGAGAGGVGVVFRYILTSQWWQRRVALRKEKVALIESKERSERAAEEARRFAEAAAKSAQQWQSAAGAMNERITMLEEADRTKTHTISVLRAELEDMWARFRAALHFIINQLDYTRVLRKLLFEHVPDQPVPDPPAMPASIQAAIDKEGTNG